jgi:hypothetical protein
MSKIAEQLHRIEHKLDLVLDSVAMHNSSTKLWEVGDSNHYCPLCLHPVEYTTDLVEGQVVRVCGCTTGRIPPSPFGTRELSIKQGSDDAGKDTPKK